MSYILPALILIILALAVAKGTPSFEAFVRGAKQGTQTIIQLVPSLIGLITAIGVLRASGAFEIVGNLLEKPLSFIGMPTELLTLIAIRPISGSAALATVRDILQQTGADSYTARVACVMMGSTETIIYTLTVYTSGTPIKKMPGVLPAAMAASLVSAVVALILCKVM